MVLAKVCFIFVINNTVRHNNFFVNIIIKIKNEHVSNNKLTNYKS